MGQAGDRGTRDLDPVVRKPINANPGLKLTDNFISLVKKCSQKLILDRSECK